MSNNLMTEICKKLNVELGEEFKVDIYGDRIFKITESGVWEKKSDDDGYIWEEQLVVLRELLIGDIQIVKLLWKPKYNEWYWTFCRCGFEKWTVRTDKWDNDPISVAFFKAGWVFRTQAEAQTALPVAAKEMGVRYEL